MRGVNRKKCSECHRLESQCQRAIEKIHSVVATRFGSVPAKVQALYAAQDLRDAAIRALNQHLDFHRSQPRDVLASESHPLDDSSAAA